jgi:hypothetical protein
VVVRQVVPTERSGFRFVVCKSELTGPCAKLTFQLVFYGICFSPKQYSGRCFCFLSRLIPPEQRHRLGDWPLCPRAKTFPRFSQPGAGQVLASDPFPGLVLQLARFWCRAQERSVSCGESFPAPIFTIVPVSVRCSAPRSASPGRFLPFDLLSGSDHSAKVLLSCSFSRPWKRAIHVRCSSSFSVRLGQADFPAGLLFGACAEFSSIPSSSPRFRLLLTSVVRAPV